MSANKLKRTLVVILVLEFIFLASLAYGLYLILVYPIMIPGYGFKEDIILSVDNNYTSTLPIRSPRTNLHIILSSENIFKVYLDDRFVGEFIVFKYSLPPYSVLKLRLVSNEYGLVKMVGRAEIPFLEVFITFSVSVVSLIYFISKYYVLKKMIESSKKT